ncbi:uncharacterized protein LOC144863551 [Branchiostoma floridae x Branchiostoma japonicum]|uniref:Uncharacterized protein n=1 Tax=Branchiostoma floridae TaxID=7739 RepID=C3XYW2_BRAFL|eukprot:XP_002610987.1 hypothetical protein BRAFLDRAFT_130873 [Branchiostoma floridae]
MKLTLCVLFFGCLALASAIPAERIQDLMSRVEDLQDQLEMAMEKRDQDDEDMLDEDMPADDEDLDAQEEYLRELLMETRGMFEYNRCASKCNKRPACLNGCKKHKNGKK